MKCWLPAFFTFSENAFCTFNGNYLSLSFVVLLIFGRQSNNRISDSLMSGANLHTTCSLMIDLQCPLSTVRLMVNDRYVFAISEFYFNVNEIFHVKFAMVALTLYLTCQFWGLPVQLQTKIGCQKKWTNGGYNYLIK